MKKVLKKSRRQSIKEMAGINRKHIINKLTQYYSDFCKTYGIIDISPVTLAEKTFMEKKRLGQLNEINEVVAA